MENKNIIIKELQKRENKILKPLEESKKSEIKA